MANWYISSVAWTAMTPFAVLTAYNIGDLRRQLAAPSTGSERAFRCTVAGTSAAAEPAWNLTKGSTTVSGTATFTEVTGNETYQGTGWAAPFARMQSPGTSWPAAGDVLFLSADHAETQASAPTIALQSGTPGADGCAYISATRPSSAIPPVAADIAAGASVTTTGANLITITSAGTDATNYLYGITFNSTNGGGSTGNMTIGGTDSQMIFDTCVFNTLGGGGSGIFKLGNSGSAAATGYNVVMKNCNIGMAAVTDIVSICGPVEWNGGTLTTSALTIGFKWGGNANVAHAPLNVHNVDLSILAGSSSLIAGATNQLPGNKVSFSRCKLSASLANVQSTAITHENCNEIDLVGCDSGTVLVREEHYRWTGTIKHDATIHKSGGATDGTTPFSWKFVATSACSAMRPLIGPDIFVWVNSTGSKVFTVEVANTASVTLTNKEFGFEIEYMGSTTTPLGTLTTTLANPGVAGTTLTTSAVTWLPAGSYTAQYATKTVTVQEKGWVRVRPYVRRASLTCYVDPLVTVV